MKETLIKNYKTEPEMSDNRILLKKVLSATQSYLDSKLRNHQAPQIVGVGIEIDKVRVVLDKEMPAPEGFATSHHNTVWQIAVASAENLPTPHCNAFPFFARMGYYNCTGCFYLNLEMAKSMLVRGDHSQICSYLSELVQEMLSDEVKCRVFCVGFGYETLYQMQLMAIERLSDILPVIEKQVESEQVALTQSKMPILIIDPFTDKRELTARLELLVSKGVSSISCYGNGNLTLEVSKNSVTISPWGLKFSTEKDSTSKSDARDDLEKLEIAPFGERLLESVSEPKRAPKHKQLCTQNGPPEIQVLGAVTIENTVEYLKSIQVISLICFLAVHRNGASSDQLMRWIWPPEEPPNRQALSNLVSRARRSLGFNSNKDPYISLSRGIYKLDKEVKSDYEDFVGLVSKAKSDKENSLKIKHLQQALSLVKGVPFSVGPSKAFLWPDTSVRGDMEFQIDTAAHMLCDIAIRQSNFEAARFALHKASITIPGCDQCVARRLIIAARSENLGALVSAKETAVATYESLGYQVPPMLQKLFRELRAKIA